MTETDIKPTRPLSPLTITALAEVIAGEARNKNGTSLGGRTRSAREIQRFMMDFGVDFSEPWSRVKDLRNCLEDLSAETTRKVILGAFDSHSFEKHYVSEESLLYFNRFFKEDGYEVIVLNDAPEIRIVSSINTEAKLRTQREQELKAVYRKEYGHDFGWFINILLLPIVVPFFLLKVLITFIFKILWEILGIAFRYLKIVLAVLLVLGVMVYLVQPSIPTAIFEHLLNSPILKLFPSAL